jgi:hypothetical protein
VVAVFVGRHEPPPAFAGATGVRRIPAFPAATPAALAIARALGYRRWRDREQGTVPDFDDVDPAAARRLLAADLAIDPEPHDLDPATAQAVLAAYGVREPVPGITARLAQDDRFGPLVELDAVGRPAFGLVPMTDVDADDLVASVEHVPAGAPAGAKELALRLALLADDCAEIVELRFGPSGVEARVAPHRPGPPSDVRRLR